MSLIIKFNIRYGAGGGAGAGGPGAGGAGADDGALAGLITGNRNAVILQSMHVRLSLFVWFDTHNCTVEFADMSVIAQRDTLTMSVDCVEVVVRAPGISCHGFGAFSI